MLRVDRVAGEEVGVVDETGVLTGPIYSITSVQGLLSIDLEYVNCLPYSTHK